MSKKLSNVFFGCLAVVQGYVYRLLLRLHILSPSADPLDDITYKILTDDRF